MKKQLLATAIAVIAGGAQADLMITGVIDGPLTGGLPKAVELYTTENIADLNTYTLKLYVNGKTEAQPETFSFKSTSVPAGTYLTVSMDVDGFTSYFGKAPDYQFSALNFNGDDSIALFIGDTEVDRFGEAGKDGTGTAWEYIDGWAYRKSAYSDSTLSKAANGGAFNSDNWDFSGINVLKDKSVKNTTSGHIMPVAGIVPEAEIVDGGTDSGSTDIGTCGDGNATLISTIQGSGSSSALVGQQVTVEAVVYQNQQTSAEGYFIQEEEADSDGNEATSEGIFVFDTSLPVTVGDKVRLSAKVSEYKGLTELSSVSGLIVCSQNNTLPAATAITLPVTSLEAFEQVEGMRVSLANSNLVVSDFHGNGYGFGNYGQFVVSNELHYQPTEVSVPSKESYDAAIENIRLSSMLIDDGQSSKAPDPIVFPNSEGFSNTNYFRVGYGISGITGAMHGYDSGNATYPYQIIPSITPTFDPLNADRTLAPIVDSSANLKIASMNVLNLYNGIIVDDKTYFPTPAEEDNDTYGDYRGANSEADYNIQVAKIVAALDAMDADVIGLMEIENDGYDETSSIAALTNALNAVQTTDGEYAFVNPGGKMGTDSISVGLLYRPAVVTPVGTTAVLDSTNSPKDGEGNPLFIDTRNRPSLIQSFTHKATGDQFTVVVNHLKSKRNSCTSDSDNDLGDGQGACNQTRTNAAKALVTFMADHPTGVNTDNVVFMGDMNAYAKEDPIAALEAGGYINLKYTSASTEAQPFSYSYSGFLGSLDHMIGSAGMNERLVSVDDWHINSLESNLLDYDTTLDTNNSNDHFASLDPYYSSDHDPVIAGFVMKSSVEGGTGDNDDKDDDSSSGSTGLLLLPVLFMLMVTRRKY